MKKIVTLLLTAALAVTAATTAFADTKIEPGPDSSPNPASGDHGCYLHGKTQLYRNHPWTCNAEYRCSKHGNGNSHRCDYTQWTKSTGYTK